MKKMKIVVFISILIFIFISLNVFDTVATGNENPPIESEMYVTAIQKLVFSTVQNEVKSRYERNVNIDYSDIKIENLSYNSQGQLIMTAKFSPYTGPHNSVSQDKIKLLIRASGITVLEYSSTTQNCRHLPALSTNIVL